jgi:ABC-2 type transport system ATP-binding protein
VARAKGVSSEIRRGEVDRVAESVGVSQVMGMLLRHLSRGFRQRVGLAQALIGNPPILILDEPTIGLDPKQIWEIRRLIKGFSRNRTVILSTHILPEVSQICDRVIIINKGTIIAEDTPANLIRSYGKFSRCQLEVAAPEGEVKQMLSNFDGVNSAKLTTGPEEGRVSALIEASSRPDLCPALARAVASKGWDLFELRRLDASLEDVFIDLVTEEADEEASAQETNGKEVA